MSFESKPNEIAQRAIDLDNSLKGVPTSYDDDLVNQQNKQVVAPANEGIARTGGLCVANTFVKKPPYMYPTDEETPAGDMSLNPKYAEVDLAEVERLTQQKISELPPQE